MLSKQQEFQKQVISEVKPKGKTFRFILKKVLPWLFENMPKIIAIWKTLKDKPDQPPVIMGGDDEKEPDPGTHPPAP